MSREAVDRLPDDFAKYAEAELEWSQQVDIFGQAYWTFWSRDGKKPPRDPGTLESLVDMTNIKEKIKYAFHNTAATYCKVLVQFWAATITDDGRTLLTAADQPFLLSAEGVGLCSYRMISKGHKFSVDRQSGEEQQEDLGVVGRVFLRQLPESTPNVEYYSAKENPLRGVALSCRITQSLAWPVSEISTRTPIGVLEAVTVNDDPNKNSLLIDFLMGYFHTVFQEVGLTLSCACEHTMTQMLSSQQEDVDKGNLIALLKELELVMEIICGSYNLPLARVWMSCHLCNVDVGMLGVAAEYLNDTLDYDDMRFAPISCSLSLKNGQGVVGRALISSHDLLFCHNVTEFSIVEYPMAHYARRSGMLSNFVICLRNIHTGSHVYALELFFPKNKTSYENSQSLLPMILGTMKQLFQTFKLVSGEELRADLPIQVIEFQNGEKIHFADKSQTTRSPYHLVDRSQNGVEMNQMDPSTQQSKDANCAKQKCTKALKRQRKFGYQISLDDLKQCASMKREDAAKILKVSIPTLKRVCREYGISRWSSREINKITVTVPSQPIKSADQEQITQLNTNFHSSKERLMNVSDKTFFDLNNVTVKATFGDDIFKFILPSQCGVTELQEEIAKRIECRNYHIKYKDKKDNDLISIVCDDDLKYCINTSRLPGNDTINILLLPNQSNC